MAGKGSAATKGGEGAKAKGGTAGKSSASVTSAAAKPGKDAKPARDAKARKEAKPGNEAKRKRDAKSARTAPPAKPTKEVGGAEQRAGAKGPATSVAARPAEKVDGGKAAETRGRAEKVTSKGTPTEKPPARKGADAGVKLGEPAPDRLPPNAAAAPKKTTERPTAKAQDSSAPTAEAPAAEIEANSAGEKPKASEKRGSGERKRSGEKKSGGEKKALAERDRREERRSASPSRAREERDDDDDDGPVRREIEPRRKTVKTLPLEPLPPVGNPEVEAFLRELEHPRKREIEVVRRWILAVDPEIRDAIKWSAPSFRTKDFFATFHLKSEDGVQLVFHLGAKVKDNSRELAIEDRVGMIRWLAADRCLVSLGAGESLLMKRRAFEDFVREWIAYVT